MKKRMISLAMAGVLLFGGISISPSTASAKKAKNNGDSIKVVETKKKKNSGDYIKAEPIEDDGDYIFIVWNMD